MTDRSAVPPVRAHSWLAFALLSVGSAGFAAAWVLLAWMRDRQCSWMAVLAALDAALLLRLARMRPGWPRAAAAVLATAAAIALANWGIVAAQMGRPMGLLPWQSLTRLGPSLAWTLATLANHPADLAWLWIALVAALLAGR
ncbi:MAG: hypothetical protein ACTHKZ_03805 [Lysobacteraceae bacterium]